MDIYEIITGLEDFSMDAIIFATPDGNGDEKKWNAHSEAIVIDWLPSEDYSQVESRVPNGMKYFLDVSLALEIIEVYVQHSGNVAPTNDQKVAAALYYAENDTYLPT